MARLLIEKGKANVNVRDQHGQNPLLIAARAGREVALKYMLDTGAAHIDVMDDSGWDPLCTAAISGHEAVVHMLLQTNDANASTSAHQIAPAPKRSLALELLEVHRAGYKIKGGRTWPPPLLWALQRSRLDLFELFLMVDPGLSYLSWIRDSRVALKMIKSAAHIGLERVVEILLSKVKTELTYQDYWAVEALRWAVKEGDCATITLFITSDRSNELFDGNYCYWLECAAECGHVAVVEQLLYSGLSQREEREHALHAAARCGSSSICQRLLEYGDIDVNFKPDGKSTSLKEAAARGHADVVKLLLSTPGIIVAEKGNFWGRSLLALLHHAKDRWFGRVWTTLRGILEYHGISERSSE